MEIVKCKIPTYTEIKGIIGEYVMETHYPIEVLVRDTLKIPDIGKVDVEKLEIRLFNLSILYTIDRKKIEDEFGQFKAFYTSIFNNLEDKKVLDGFEVRENENTLIRYSLDINDELIGRISSFSSSFVNAK